jgi:hypothetical protein
VHTRINVAVCIPYSKPNNLHVIAPICNFDFSIIVFSVSHRHAQDVREHYERKLERANNLYMELTACMLQLEKRERELLK